MPYTILNEADAAFGEQAELDSVDLSILALGFAESAVLSGLLITATTPNLTVKVGGGRVIQAGVFSTIVTGDMTLGAADPSYARFDLITINSAGVKTVVPGVAAQAPVFPVPPAGSIVLAAVEVPPAWTGLIDPDWITDKRIMPVRSQLWDTENNARVTTRPTTGILTTQGFIEFTGARSKYLNANHDILNSAGTRMMRLASTGVGGIPRIGINVLTPGSTARLDVLENNQAISGNTLLMEFSVSAVLAANAPLLMFSRFQTLGAGMDLNGFTIDDYIGQDFAYGIADWTGGGTVSRLTGIRFARGSTIGSAIGDAAAVDIITWEWGASGVNAGFRQRQLTLHNRFAGPCTFGADNDPDPWAQVDFQSTTKAIIFPRVTSANRDLMTPVEGMALFQSTDARFEHYQGGNWVPMGGVAGAHNFLSATHSDVVAAAVQTGDILLGNATPAWERLPRAIPAAGFRNILGLDNGDTVPAWKALLDNTLPANVSPAGITGGTSLTAARRDHVHGINDEVVESRHLTPTVRIETATSNTTINSGSDTDINGCTMTFTPAIASTAIVVATVDVEYTVAGSLGGEICIVELDVDGVDEASQVVVEPPAGSRVTLSQVWLVNLTAAAHTLKLQGRAVYGGTAPTFVISSPHTRIMVTLIGDANVTIS